MKAVVWTAYGPADVLKACKIPVPTPKDNEVLIRIHATTVSPGDCEIRSFTVTLEYFLFARLYFGILRPRKGRILGQELAGEIVSVGKDVTRFKEGDKVFGSTGFGLGTYAQFKCLPEDGALALKPTSMTYEEAAPLPIAGQNALFFLRHGNIKEGDKVLVYGASGGFGTYGVQIAKAFGADVSAVCSAKSFDLVRSLGAGQLFDYTKDDFIKSRDRYDVIFDPLGFSPYLICLRKLKDNGYYLLANPKFSEKWRGRWASLTSGKKVITTLASENAEDLDYLRDLIEEGKLRTVVDRTYPLEQIVEAHRYVEKRTKIGNVVISVGE
jgi:NADPH:quinone reductase-like Zn-dependent oxidoreductase